METAEVTTELELIGDEPFSVKCAKSSKNTLAVAAASTVAGLGMFAESYYMFAIGNIKTIWKTLYPDCFPSSSTNSKSDCSQEFVASLEFIEVAMIIFGMLIFGPIAAYFGRRKGSLATIGLMSVGACLVTAAYAGGAETGFFLFFALGLGILGVGVGGEYPLASVSAAERAEANKKENGNQNVRGQAMQFTFAMQGWGNWANTAMICLLLMLSQQSNCPSTYSPNSTLTCSNSGLEFTWRYQFGLVAPVLIAIFAYRFVSLPESSVWLERENQNENEPLATQEKSTNDNNKTTESDSKEELDEDLSSDSQPNQPFPIPAVGWQKTWLLIKNYWHRLLGTCSAWFLWDVAFYGNKLFQGNIIAEIIGKNTTMLQVLQYTLLNSSVGLVGYYLAALTIDSGWMGRWRMQNMGFLISFFLFGVSAIWYEELEDNPSLFTMIYLVNTLFGQWGPNCTTWLLPSELFPTEIRAQAHGISAAAGKAGALLATLIFAHGGPEGGPMEVSTIFYISAACSAAGLLFSMAFCSDVTSMDLSERDKRWDHLKAGTAYSGPAVAPHNMSFFERIVHKILTDSTTPLFVMKINKCL